MSEMKFEGLLVTGGHDHKPACIGREGHRADWAVMQGSLTEVDQHVMNYLRSKLSEAEIAAELNLPVIAVHRSIRRILRLVGANAS